MAHTQKNIKITFLAVLLTKLFVLIINLVKIYFFTEEKMSAEEEEKFQLSNSC